jgi:hypothetical protein
MDESLASLEPNNAVNMVMSQNEALTHLNLGQYLQIRQIGASVSTDLGIRRWRALNASGVSVRFLVERLAGTPPEGSTPLKESKYDSLLAIAYLVVEYGMKSDLIYLDLTDAKIVVDDDSQMSIFCYGLDAAEALFSRRMMASRTFTWRTMSELLLFPDQANGPPPIEPSLDNAFKSEYQLSLTEFMYLSRVLSDAAEEQGTTIVSLSQDRAAADALLAHQVPSSATNEFVRLLSLVSRESFRTPPEPFSYKDTAPWRFHRGLSYKRRPLIVRERNARPLLTWTHVHTVTSLMDFVEDVVQGRITPRSPDMKRYRAGVSGKRGDPLEREIVEVLARQHDIRVFPGRVTFNGVRLLSPDGKDLGDIDVLAANSRRRELVLIEAKNLGLHGAPNEYRRDLWLTRDDEANDGFSAVRLQQLRVDWVCSHTSDVATETGLAGLDGWRIAALIVTSDPTFIGCTYNGPVPIWDFGTLRDEWLVGWTAAAETFAVLGRQWSTRPVAP